MKKIAAAFIFIVVIFSSTQFTFANEGLTKGQAISIVKDTFRVQVSLSEELRTMEEVFELLKPYMTSDYRSKFLEENLVYIDGKYQTLGSDFAPYYIPFFHYNNETKFMFKDGVGYVYEKVDASSEGPVRYQDGYMGVEIIKDNGEWKVHNILRNEDIESLIDKEISNASVTLDVAQVKLSEKITSFIPSIFYIPIYHASLLMGQAQRLLA
ncbi:hypothetical protein GCM10008967_14410 [Bacillus carboniphilus]|uniref:DUF3993 domain-containing protein n=1 Tax=Bacillus carboniphilus TaxID=86663 RepID=A0ABN0W4J1_9BACI